MKKLNFALYLFVMGLFFFQSCEKDALTAPPPAEHAPTVFNVNDEAIGTRSTDGMKTVLGEFRENPYTVERMAEAHNNLYGTSLTKMQTTNLYVKFSPASFDDVRALDDTDVHFFDFPMEYEVVEMGEYWQELTEGAFPELYTVVPIDFTFPDVEHEVLAELYTDKSDPLLMAESFRLIGKGEEFAAEFNAMGVRPDELDPDVLATVIPDNPIPDCPPGFYPAFVINVTAGDVEPSWTCLSVIANETLGPYTPVACSCSGFSDKRKPTGCVTVEDTELSISGDPSTYQAVRKVKITAWNGWFDLDYAETDDSGCWKINDKYRGNAWFWLKFKNDRCKIRGVGDGIQNAWQWKLTMVDFIGHVSGPDFSDIRTNYHMWNNNGSNAHRYWGAATVNNALHEFHEYAEDDGINPPPNGLDVYVAKESRIGNAFMRSFLGNQLAEQAVLQGWTGSWIDNELLADYVAFLLTFGNADVIIDHFPDVNVGIDHTRSDRLKHLAYHEFTHASHFTFVGPHYWADLVTATVENQGWGNENSNGADIISICESWAEYLGGHDYVDRTYGGNNSVPANLGGTWIARVEETWNDSPNHVPIGLHHDLVDMGEAGQACLDDDRNVCTTITDGVSGFTNAQLFACMTANSVDDFRNCLNANFTVSTGNTVAAVNALVAQY